VEQKGRCHRLGGIRFDRRSNPWARGGQNALARLLEAGSKLQTPVTIRRHPALVGHEWSLRHIQFKFGNNYFNNASVFFFSGDRVAPSPRSWRSTPRT
jgi:hypothetical protein